MLGNEMLQMKMLIKSYVCMYNKSVCSVCVWATNPPGLIRLIGESEESSTLILAVTIFLSMSTPSVLSH